MASPCIPAPEELWGKHEKLTLEVFMLALEMLREKTDLPVDEPEINEVLSLKTRQANFSLNQKDRGLLGPPNWERPKQPASETELGQSKKAKRPDFSCFFRNYAAQSHEDAYIEYHVECKRLGIASSSGWNFNKNYVTEGIYRFISPIHRYGERAFSGAMIGYVQSMNLKSILDEVNEHIQDNSEYKTPQVSFHENEFGADGIARTSQQLARKHVSPSPFDLHHLWVDLRR